MARPKDRGPPTGLRCGSTGRRGGSELGSLLPPLLLALGTLSTLACPAQGQATSDPSQVAALQSVMQSLGGPLPQLWGSSGPDPCASPFWQGVTCRMDASLRVVIELDLPSLGLAGTIPDALSVLTSLTELNLAYNPLIQGPIPDSLFNLKQLQKLSLQACSLSGPLPLGVGSLLDLGYLSVRGNNLSGSLPQSITSLKRLWWFDIIDNGFTGPLPDGMASIDTLEHLHLSNNQLTGMPMDITRLPNLEHLVIDNNKVNQELPAGIMSMPKIQIVYLSNNTFLVSDPAILTGDAPTLIEFVAQNALKGPLPIPLPDYSNKNLSALRILDLSNSTVFVGASLPESITTLRSLITLNLGGNNLTGPLLPTVTNLAKLEHLGLEGNHLDSVEPVPDLALLPRAANLSMHLQGNNITRVALGNVLRNSFLQMLLEGNPVCAGSTIPACLPPNCKTTWTRPPPPCAPDIIAQCEAQTTDRGNIFVARVPTASALGPGSSISSNSSQCLCISPLVVRLWLLRPTFPDFTDERAATMQALTVKVLNDNEVPTTADQVVVQRAVQDCSPPFLVTLHFFRSPNGTLDDYGIKNVLQAKYSYLADDGFGLQVVKDSIDPAPPAPSPSSGGPSKGLIAAIVGGALAAIVLASLAVLVWYLHTREPGIPGLKRYSYKQLRKFTKDFDESRRLGEHGQVYLGLIPGDNASTPEKVAVKWIQGSPGVPGAHGAQGAQGAQAGAAEGPSGAKGDEFRNELVLLANMKHRNIVKLRGYCREKDLQLLVTQFAEYGTLADWLRPQEEGALTPPRALGWRQRLHIAVGAASGLAYLHDGLLDPIVHGDIRAQNILLVEAGGMSASQNGLPMDALVADFGLARSAEANAPSIIDRGEATKESDVYSFGIILLQLATEWTVEEIERHAKEGTLGPEIEGLETEKKQESFSAFVGLAMRCIGATADREPDMGEVYDTLRNMWDRITGAESTQGHA